MASKVADTRGIVVKKTRLGEADSIITLLITDGSQLSFVAKSARKPKTGFSAYFELFNTVDVTYAQTRSLGIAREARLVDAPFAHTRDAARLACAMSIAELALKLTQPDMSIPRLYDLTFAALGAISECAPQTIAPTTAAYFTKAISMAGYKPVFSNCASCDNAINLCGEGGGPCEGNGTQTYAFSPDAGGVVCTACATQVHFILVPARIIDAAECLLKATFQSICEKTACEGLTTQTALDVCNLMADFINRHLGIRIKSLNILPVFFI